MMQGTRPTGSSQPHFRPETREVATIEGMWVLLLANEGELPDQDADGRVPALARAGDGNVYLLAFKNVVKARQFLASSDMQADARMVVRGNKDELLRVAKAAGVVGTLVDYDAVTQNYGAVLGLG